MYKYHKKTTKEKKTLIGFLMKLNNYCYFILAGLLLNQTNLHSAATITQETSSTTKIEGSSVNSELVRAASIGDLTKIEELLKLGADVNGNALLKNDSDGHSWSEYTPLMAAALKNQIDAARLLIRLGANINVIRDPNNDKFYDHYGTEIPFESEDVLNYHEGEANGATTALMIAATKGYRDIVELLTSNKAKVDIADKFGETALAHAAEQGHLHIVKSLIDAGANVKSTNIFEDTVLMRAIAGSQGQPFDIIKLLIDSGADVNASVNEQGNTPLIFAIENCNKDLVSFLLSNGADIEENQTVYYASRELGARASFIVDRAQKQRELLSMIAKEHARRCIIVLQQAHIFNQICEATDNKLIKFSEIIAQYAVGTEEEARNLGRISKFSSSPISASKQNPIQALASVGKGHPGIIFLIDIRLTKGSGKLFFQGEKYRSSLFKQTASIALQYIKDNALDFKIDPREVSNLDFYVIISGFNLEGHMYFEGLYGNSAGVAFVVALVSALKKINVDRAITITGAINKDGSVGPIGAIAEKVMAAGNKFVLAPVQNVKELISTGIKYPAIMRPMTHVRDVLRFCGLLKISCKSQ